MAGYADQIDLLSSLVLPDRYETLSGRLGSQLAQLLVPPSPESRGMLKRLVSSVRGRREGLFVPLHGPSGAGKTTFASNVHSWEPADLAPTLEFSGDISFDQMAEEVRKHRSHLPANDSRSICINIDHRESAPPNEQELSTIKRFLRTSPGGTPCIIFWPEVSVETAVSISQRYASIAGAAPIDLPLSVSGPERSAWQDIAINTLSLSNNLADIDLIGVNPRDFDPSEFATLGEYLRRLSRELNDNLFSLKSSLEKPVEVIIVFVSESSDPGVLSQLTNNSRYGLLDATSLLAVTPESVIGRWWSARRGLLTRTIIQLNAHALALGPAAAVSVLRNCGPSPDPFLDSLGVPRVGANRAVRDLQRTDLGKLLTHQKLDRFESRGAPTQKSGAAFQQLAARGFNLGRDKGLNKIMSVALSALLKAHSVTSESVRYEKVLDFCPLIPDVSIDLGGSIICLEYTWRKGEFLTQGNRSTVAQYILQKLQNYARELGWTVD